MVGHIEDFFGNTIRLMKIRSWAEFSSLLSGIITMPTPSLGHKSSLSLHLQVLHTMGIHCTKGDLWKSKALVTWRPHTYSWGLNWIWRSILWFKKQRPNVPVIGDESSIHRWCVLGPHRCGFEFWAFLCCGVAGGFWEIYWRYIFIYIFLYCTCSMNIYAYHTYVQRMHKNA